MVKKAKQGAPTRLSGIKKKLQMIFETKRKKIRDLYMCDSDPSKSKTEMNVSFKK